MINTASFVAVLGAATSQISYTASKGGVLALSRELGVEFARAGGASQRALPRARSTRPCCVSSTPRTPSRPPAGSCTCRWAALPAPRRSRNAVLFLASDESSYVNATSFLVDGGHQRRVHDAAVIAALSRRLGRVDDGVAARRSGSSSACGSF